MSDTKQAPVPIPECYRVLPNGFLAGEYPGSVDAAQARRKLEALVDAGTRVFVDLTEPDELRPYDALAREVAAERSVDVEHLRFGIPDTRTPREAAQMTRILDAIEDALRAERGVYLHCYGGVGRTGLTVACFFVRLGLSPDEALDHLARLWKTVPKSHTRKPRSPENDQQVDWVRAWSEPGRISRRARTRGALLGLAAGDALGTTLEFRTPGSFAPVDDITGGGPFHLKPGEWTDDTSMALCLATSLLEKRGFDAGDQMRRYRRWQGEGYLSSNGRCFDIGVTVSEALRRFAATGDPVAGSTDRRKAGNGSLMRLAPVPLFYAAEPDEAIRRSAESSLTTHGAPQAVDACAWMAAAIVGALEGRPKAEVLGPGTTTRAERALGRALDTEIRPVVTGSFARLSPPEIRGTGFVVKSLEAALWALHTTDDFRGGALAAVNLGDDADTTGAVYGQLAGALYGEEGIPRRWRELLAKGEEIAGWGDALFRAAHGVTGPSGAADP